MTTSPPIPAHPSTLTAGAPTPASPPPPGVPKRRAAKATAWPWLPLEWVINPRARTSLAIRAGSGIGAADLECADGLELLALEGNGNAAPRIEIGDAQERRLDGHALQAFARRPAALPATPRSSAESQPAGRPTYRRLKSSIIIATTPPPRSARPRRRRPPPPPLLHPP